MAVGLQQLAAQTVYVSNLSQTYTPSSYTGVTATQWLAQPFTTGSTDTTLASIGMAFNSGGSGTGIVFRLYTAGSGAPGTLLSTLSTAGAPASGGTITFTPASAIQLSANTTYWAVASASSGSSFRASITTATGETSADGWSIANNRYATTNSGTSWNSGGNLLRISVSASAIPEPSTYAACAGVAVLGLAVWRRRRAA